MIVIPPWFDWGYCLEDKVKKVSTRCCVVCCGGEAAAPGGSALAFLFCGRDVESVCRQYKGNRAPPRMYLEYKLFVGSTIHFRKHNRNLAKPLIGLYFMKRFMERTITKQLQPTVHWIEAIC